MFADRTLQAVLDFAIEPAELAEIALAVGEVAEVGLGRVMKERP